jgi:RimJ/RimL family protein N-acetyltransferase
MRLAIVSKNQLDEAQRQYLNGRLMAPEHANDNGAIRAWGFDKGLYAFICNQTNVPVGIAEASGGSTRSPGWWIDSQFRGQGFGYELIDLLAEQLKSEGVTAIGRIPIDTYLGLHHETSSKLAQRLRRHFE